LTAPGSGRNLPLVIRPPGTGADGRSGLVRLALLLTGTAAILSYDAVGHAFYGGFRIPQGTGMNSLAPEEVTQIAMFTTFGAVAVAALAAALHGTAPVSRAIAALSALARRPHPAALAAAALAGAAAALVASAVLGHAVVTDDEHTYRFIAQTLRTGALVAPSPGADLEFFGEQFVVLTPTARYGKYPIGYPLLLAAGQAAGAEEWVVPLLTSAIVALVYAIGSWLFDPLRALVAVALVGTSPQVLLTGATYLSQPISAVCMLAGLAALVAADRRLQSAPAGRTEPLGLLVLAGACLGYGVFVRPLPGALFAAVAGLHVLWARRGAPWSRLVPAAAAFGIPLALGSALLLVQNRLQSGDAFTSGYQTFHATGEGSGGLTVFVAGGLAPRAMSLVAGVLRLEEWAFGWPLAPLLALGALRVRGAGLLWGLISAAVAYRLLAPKAGVSPTGPVYLYEIVPILALLVAVGAVELARRLRAPSAVAATLVAGVVVCLTMFLPGRIADLYSMGLAQRTPFLLLARAGVHHGLVFQSATVPWWTRRSWAYYPRANSPRLDDDVLFLHVGGRDDLDRARELWRRRFPDRSAWWFEYVRDQPRLVPLDQAIAESPTASAPAPSS
jgi:4-amino-4-deoxy-L-arabinose transferase-like glycosyltransferase